VANAGALLGETFQKFLIGVGEGGGCGGKNFEDSGELGVVYIENRNNEDRAYAEASGDDGIDAADAFADTLRKDRREC
jgi:hypothetical protein